MIEIKEVTDMAEMNNEYVELKTRVQVVEEYIKNESYPTIKMICVILGIPDAYVEEE